MQKTSNGAGIYGQKRSCGHPRSPSVTGRHREEDEDRDHKRRSYPGMNLNF